MEDDLAETNPSKQSKEAYKSQGQEQENEEKTGEESINQQWNLEDLARKWRGGWENKWTVKKSEW